MAHSAPLGESLGDLKDGEPAPLLDVDRPFRSVYVDNITVGHFDEHTVNEHHSHLLSVFPGTGLEPHESYGATQNQDVLGFSLTNGREVVNSSKRVWRFINGVRHLMTWKSCSGVLLVIVVGHFVSLAMGCRWLLSLLGAVYSFMDQAGKGWLALTGAVLRELRWMVSLLPLARVALDLPYSDSLTCSDASGADGGSGYALLVTQENNARALHEAAKHKEMWWFRELAGGELHERLIHQERLQRRRRKRDHSMGGDDESELRDEPTPSISSSPYLRPPGLPRPHDYLRVVEGGHTGECDVPVALLGQKGGVSDLVTPLDSMIDAEIEKQESDARRGWQKSRTERQRLQRRLVRARVVPNPDFPSIPKELVGNKSWRVLRKGIFRKPEEVVMFEGRASLMALEWRARDVRHHHKRHLHFCDNQSFVLAMAKGRSSHRGVLGLLRRATSLVLATGMEFSIRWLAGSRNPADEPSRPRTAQYVLRK